MSKTQINESQYVDTAVPLSAVFFDESYARDFIKAHVKKMAQNWNERLVDVIRLSRRPNGLFACLNGWQRVNAARRRDPDGTILALVDTTLTHEEEAYIFGHLNSDVVRVTPAQRFRASLMAKESASLAIQRILDGLELTLGQNGLTITSVINVYEQDTTGCLLQSALKIHEAAWPKTKAYSQASLPGIARFLIRYPAVDHDRLSRQLHEESPESMKLIAKTYSRGWRSSTPNCYGRALREVYNKRLSKNRLEDWG